MINRIFILTIISQLFFSCKNQEDKLEIYLTKNLVESYEGVPLRKAFKDSSIISNIENLYGEKIRVDTVTKKMIYSGRFNVSKNDLQEKPFILNSEILGLDFKKSEIIFNRSVSENIYKVLPYWKNSTVRGRQFVLLRNNRIILKGYLFGSMSSYWSNTYQIHFYNVEKLHQKTVRFSLNDSINFNENHLMKNKELVSAFLKRNKNLNGL
jgi:hypothetical protein